MNPRELIAHCGATVYNAIQAATKETDANPDRPVTGLHFEADPTLWNAMVLFVNSWSNQPITMGLHKFQGTVAGSEAFPNLPVMAMMWPDGSFRVVFSLADGPAKPGRITVRTDYEKHPAGPPIATLKDLVADSPPAPRLIELFGEAEEEDDEEDVECDCEDCQDAAEVFKKLDAAFSEPPDDEEGGEEAGGFVETPRF